MIYLSMGHLAKMGLGASTDFFSAALIIPHLKYTIFYNKKRLTL